MTLFICTATPFLKILLTSGEYASFEAGQLEVAETDPFYEEVLAEATRNASISIMTNATTCRFCGAEFIGDKAKAKLEDHSKEVHFDLWVKQQEIDAATVIQKEIKSRAGYVCDICAPVQTFGSEADLAEHVNTLHTKPPALDDDGNELGGGDPDRRPGEVNPAGAPAAVVSTRGTATTADTTAPTPP